MTNEVIDAEVVESNVVMALPNLVVNVVGSVSSSNLAEYKAGALKAIESINMELNTDMDFDQARDVVKWCKSVETNLALAKEKAIAQTKDIADLFTAMDEVSIETRSKRLVLEKLIKTRTEVKKQEAVLAVKVEWNEYREKCLGRMGGLSLPNVPADFDKAIKGKRSLDSINQALTGVMMAAKVALADVMSEHMSKRDLVMEAAGDYKYLFNDIQQHVHKTEAELRELVESRVAVQKEKEDKKEREKREAMRETLREEIKAEAPKNLAPTVTAQRESIGNAFAQHESRVAEHVGQQDSEKSAVLSSMPLTSDEVDYVGKHLISIKFKLGSMKKAQLIDELNKLIAHIS